MHELVRCSRLVACMPLSSCTTIDLAAPCACMLTINQELKRSHAAASFIDTRTCMHAHTRTAAKLINNSHPDAHTQCSDRVQLCHASWVHVWRCVCLRVFACVDASKAEYHSANNLIHNTHFHSYTACFTTAHAVELEFLFPCEYVSIWLCFQLQQ